MTYHIGLTPALTHEFDLQYIHVMQRIWNHPENDQRPAVLEWLKPLQGIFTHILDIGPGDAYYLDHLKPKRYTVVEPNLTFRKMARERANNLKISAYEFSSVKSFLNRRTLHGYDLVMMIHVLFYMKLREIEMLLSKIVSKPLVVVYPSPECSISTQFEAAIGLNCSRKRINLMQELLGRPDTSKLITSHFRLPLDTPLESLAFLVAHHMLDRKWDDDKIDAAKSFVLQKEHLWRHPFGYQIPQYQVLEYYNLADCWASQNLDFCSSNIAPARSEYSDFKNL